MQFDELVSLCERYSNEEAKRKLEVLMGEDAIDLLVSESRFSLKKSWADLLRIFNLITKTKVSRYLEFGSGLSTIIADKALAYNEKNFTSPNGARANDSFNGVSVDESAEWVALTKATQLRLGLNGQVQVQHSPATVTEFDHRVVSRYQKLPDITLELIYLDGPSHFINDALHNDLTMEGKTPVSSDILFSEFTLHPGAVVLVEGRKNNVNFLKSYLRRNWRNYTSFEQDFTLFYLAEEPLGTFNKKLLQWRDLQ